MNGGDEGTPTEPNYFDMSDEEIMKQSAPTPVPAVTEVAETDPNAEAAAAAAETERLAAEKAEADRLAAEQAALAAADTTGDEAAGEEDEATKAAKAAEAAAAAGSKTGAEEVVPGAGSAAADDKAAASAKTEPTAEDYKSFYESLIGKPIKANGKDLTLQNPEEVVRMIQMGANYTKKMQALQPALQVIRMLENNGLMDSGKLAHLIDISKGDSGAIQKLLTDHKFDPLTVDAEKAAGYTPGNHQVSDQEMAFSAALEEAETSPTGLELIQEVAQQWDPPSRQALFQEPALIQVLNSQKINGIYGLITTEIDRQRALGHLQNVPFLQAYRTVGDSLQAAGLLVPKSTALAPVPNAAVAERVVAPPAQVVNNDQAKAASATKTNPSSAKTEPNFLDMSDDEFLKQMNGRV